MRLWRRWASPCAWYRRIPQPVLRYFRVICFLALCTSILLWLHALLVPGEFPPLYDQYVEWERNLPQHDPSLPFPEGRHAKFLYFPNHQKLVGFGNVLQEMFMNGLLAYQLKRSFVIDNYTWNPQEIYYRFNWFGPLMPSKIPVSAMLAGPLVGGPWRHTADVPRAVSREYYKTVCPTATSVSCKDIYSKLPPEPTAKQVLTAMIERFNEIEDRCLELGVFDERPICQIFDFHLFGSPKILEIWPMLSQSPIITELGWSPLILNAFMANTYLFTRFSLDTPPDTSTSTLNGLIAVHLRRGDFVHHCNHLTKWSSSYNGFNTFEALPDRFSPPPGGSWGKNTPENYQIYRDRCFPSIPAIVKRIAEVKRESEAHGPPLKRLYIMTNGRPDWLDDLKRALEMASSGQWESIGTSRDLQLNPEQKHVSHTLDMYIGLRAQVFIGNGFSSLTSNVVMLRMGKNLDPQDTRFW